MPTETNHRFRILYLTHALTSTGAACLVSLIEAGYDVVGVVTPRLRYNHASLIHTVAALLRRRGWAFTALIAFRVLVANARVALRRVLPAVARWLEGFESIDEVGHVHRLRRLCPSDVHGPQFLDEAAALEPDLVVVGISDRILKDEFLSRFPGRVINVHPSPLPRFRGPDPLYWQLVLDQSQGAVSVHYVTAEIDGGNLLAQEHFPIEPGERESVLKQRIDRVAPRVLITAIERFRQGSAGRAQSAAEATYQRHRPMGLAACFPRRPRRPLQRPGVHRNAGHPRP